MNLVGNIIADTPEADQLDFLVELEQLMLRYRISNVNVGWKFGTDWSGVKIPDPDQEQEQTRASTEEHARNIAVLSQPNITPKKPFVMKGGPFVSSETDILDTLDTLVNKIEQEEADNIPRQSAQSEEKSSSDLYIETSIGLIVEPKNDK